MKKLLFSGRVYGKLSLVSIFSLIIALTSGYYFGKFIFSSTQSLDGSVVMMSIVIALLAFVLTYSLSELLVNLFVKKEKISA